MLNIADTLHRWCREVRPFALATVVDVTGSAPLPVGTSVAVDEDGNAVGSISGGCVEGAVYELARTVVASGEPVLERYGVSDDDAFAVGLTCGGILDVFVEQVSRTTFPQLGEVAADIEAGRPVALATVIEHPDPAWVGRRMVVRPHAEADGSLGSPRADAAVHEDQHPRLGREAPDEDAHALAAALAVGAVRQRGVGARGQQPQGVVVHRRVRTR